jgi:hypothetical protein
MFLLHGNLIGTSECEEYVIIQRKIGHRGSEAGFKSCAMRRSVVG